MASRNPFTSHPASVDETYLEHMHQAGSFGLRMILGGLACVIHGLLPFAFTTTGSDQVRVLHRRMVTHRNRKQAPANAPADAPAA